MSSVTQLYILQKAFSNNPWLVEWTSYINEEVIVNRIFHISISTKRTHYTFIPAQNISHYKYCTLHINIVSKNFELK